jgi:hypothetical protein
MFRWAFLAASSSKLLRHLTCRAEKQETLMNKLISLDDSALDQVSGGGPIVNTASNVINGVLGGLGRVEDKAEHVLGNIGYRVGGAIGSLFGGLKGAVDSLLGHG